MKESNKHININDGLARELALKAIAEPGFRIEEIDRHCWMVVHEYHHGHMPLEYDIREVDEDLYLEVLKAAKSIYSQATNK